MIYYIMGVSGSGKTTVGQLLAKELKLPFFDADDFHSAENVAKMAAGQALTDADRASWLLALNQKACQLVNEGSGAVIACSGLKERYRAVLGQNINTKTHWVHLQGSYDLIHQRMGQRPGHYMPAGLLKSQFEALEPPTYGLHLSIDQKPQHLVATILSQSKPMAEFGLIGLGVMGKSLARNLGRNGVRLALYNRYVAGSEEKVAENFIASHAELAHSQGFEDLEGFVNSLALPRKIFIMVNAGVPTDAVINSLKPWLSPGDIVLDGGNAHYLHTQTRAKELAAEGIHFVGTGVSGGEQGALWGPSIMPGGHAEAYTAVAPFLERIAAKDSQGKPCCTPIGQGGAGHFVKMVHNGIEYAEMQLIAEVFALLRYVNGLSYQAIATIFDNWNKGPLSSYLLEISAKILRAKDSNENYVLDQIVDSAGNKGTGSWTTSTMAEAGIPATIIGAALFARFVSSFVQKRTQIQQSFLLPQIPAQLLDIGQVAAGYSLARKLNHEQGFELIAEVAFQQQWNINLTELARIWTNGCIIRSKLMELGPEAFELKKIPVKELTDSLLALRACAGAAIHTGISIPCLLAGLDYTHAHLYHYPTAHIIQAQRDFFGAHTFMRIGDTTAKPYHHNWE
jgi:6-phosphogluconate dehydrogenase